MFQNRLAREVATVVVVKTAIVLLAAFFVFGPRQRPTIDATAVEQHLMALPAVSAFERKSHDGD
jgi:hypothetical protein